MIAYKFHLVGFQLLILAYVGQSFVLITANMDDIKKLAKKFVSESLADKMAEFVVQATQTMMTNLSTEDGHKNIQFLNNLFDENSAFVKEPVKSPWVKKDLERERLELKNNLLYDINEKYIRRARDRSGKYPQKDINEISDEEKSAEHLKLVKKYPKEYDRTPQYHQNKQQSNLKKEFQTNTKIVDKPHNLLKKTTYSAHFSTTRKPKAAQKNPYEDSSVSAETHPSNPLYKKIPMLPSNPSYKKAPTYPLIPSYKDTPNEYHMHSSSSSEESKDTKSDSGEPTRTTPETTSFIGLNLDDIDMTTTNKTDLAEITRTEQPTTKYLTSESTISKMTLENEKEDMDAWWDKKLNEKPALQL